jgi:hypothetical protein
MTDLSEYEKARLKNIEENQKLLEQLGLSDIKTDLQALVDSQKRKPPPRDPNKPKKYKKKKLTASRQSRRLLGIPAEIGGLNLVLDLNCIVYYFVY